jgi:mRNA interferase RelE/StbE
MTSLCDVQISEPAAKEIRNLPRDVMNRIVPRIVALANEPRPSGCKKLKGSADLYRIRVGDYRILYTIDDKGKIVIVRAVRHRQQAYE